MKTIVVGLNDELEPVLHRIDRSSIDTVCSARSTKEALDLLQRDLFHVCFVSWRFLERDDSEDDGCIGSIRELQPTIAVVLTGLPPGQTPTDEKTRRYALRAGVDVVLTDYHQVTSGDQLVGVIKRRSLRRQKRLTSGECRVLVVDDEEDIVLPTVVDALERAGIHALAATSGYQALEVIREHDVDVLLTDVMMPGISGHELVDAVLRYEPDITPLVMTGFPSIEFAIRALAQGAQDFLIKPVRPKNVVKAVRRAWDRGVLGGRLRRVLQGRPRADRATPLGLLLVQDGPTQAEWTTNALQEAAPGTFAVTRLSLLSQALEVLDAAPGRFDAVLVDLKLPDSEGLSTVVRLRLALIDSPIVVIANEHDKALVEQARLCGAHDLVIKGRCTGPLIVTRLLHAIERRGLLNQMAALAQELRASNIGRRLLIDRNVDAIVVTNLDGTVLFANPAAESLLGRGAPELLGEPLGHPVVLGAAQEIKIDRADEKTVTAELRVAPTDWDSKSAYLVSIRDITDRKRNEELRMRLMHADKLACIGQLSAGVAHEINNPLCSVMGNLELSRFYLESLEPAVQRLMVDLDLPGTIRKLLKMNNENLAGAERIATIVRALRNFSRIEQDDVGLVDINEVVNAASDMVSKEIRHRARLVKDLSSVPAIVADRGKLCQVLVNLLINAAHATEQRTADDHVVSVSTSHVDRFIAIAVEDSGCGIPEDVLPHVFEPFFTTKTRDEGTGLGLSLCSEIVCKHRGEINVQSTVGRGSCFRITLPLDTGMKLRPAPRKSEAVQASGDHLRVLLVDDEPMVRVTLRRLLEWVTKDRVEVVEAKGGADALAQLERDRTFDVVLCDLMMPGMDGVDLYRATGIFAPEILERFVFISGGACTPHAKAFVATTSRIVLDKPVPADRLYEIISLVAEKGRARRDADVSVLAATDGCRQAPTVAGPFDSQSMTTARGATGQILGLREPAMRS